MTYDRELFNRLFASVRARPKMVPDAGFVAPGPSRKRSRGNPMRRYESLELTHERFEGNLLVRDLVKMAGPAWWNGHRQAEYYWLGDLVWDLINEFVTFNDKTGREVVEDWIRDSLKDHGPSRLRDGSTRSVFASLSKAVAIAASDQKAVPPEPPRRSERPGRASALNHIEWMKDFEARYCRTSGLSSRAAYKIFYCPVRPAQILVLGINPGGDPATIEPDGVTDKKNPKHRHAASATFYENDEHDILDCDWTENVIRDVLTDILGNREAIRKHVSKSNLAFRRSPETDALKSIHGMNLSGAYKEARPFVREILEMVCPRLVLLEGSILDPFNKAVNSKELRALDKPIETMHRGRTTDLYRAGLHAVPRLGEMIVVKLAHPSYHGLKYADHDVGGKIRKLFQRVALQRAT